MRIVIAEDEYLERMAMRKFLEENFDDITIVGEATNGRKAIEMALQMKPEIMLMDIKMPGVNGIEAIKEIIKKEPKIKFIIISAFDSFVYAKEAMSFGVKDYILKPSKKEEMIRAFLRVKNEINDESENKKHSELIAKELLITKLTKNDLSNHIIDLQHDLYPFMHSGYFFIFSSYTQGLDYLIKKATEISQDTVLVKEENNQVVLLFISKEKRTKSDLYKVARNLQQYIERQTFIGMGYPYTKLVELPRSYHEALKAVKEIKQSVNRKYGFEGEEGKGWEVIVDRIVSEIIEGNEQTALHFLNQLIVDEKANKEDQLLALFYRIKYVFEERQLELPSKSFVHLREAEEWIDFIKLSCFSIQLYYKSQDKIERAKKYINEHYQETITLEEIAQYVDLSTSYFSNLFKDSCGETFVDYVTTIRMNKAKEFLLENKYSLKEISNLVGYRNPNYFSRVFKKYFSTSPKQFQQKILK